VLCLARIQRRTERWALDAVGGGRTTAGGGGGYGGRACLAGLFFGFSALPVRLTNQWPLSLGPPSTPTARTAFGPVSLAGTHPTLRVLFLYRHNSMCQTGRKFVQYVTTNYGQTKLSPPSTQIEQLQLLEAFPPFLSKLDYCGSILTQQ
jgi:hypothetical protein